MRFFNTAGQVNCKDHYCISPLKRFEQEEIELLINQKKYFVLHAPRQTGKTTCMLALMDFLNRQGKYKVLYCNVEAAQASRENIEQAMNDIVREMAVCAQIYLQDDFLDDKKETVFRPGGYGTALSVLLTAWAKESDKPIVSVHKCLIFA